MFYSKATNNAWLEASTERSESNPGRSLGITKRNRSNAVWKTVPTLILSVISDKSVFEKKTRRR